MNDLKACVEDVVNAALEEGGSPRITEEDIAA